MIIVTGATGKLGKMVVDQLLKHLKPGEIGVSVRDPKKAMHLEEHGIRVRAGDFEDAKSLTHALEGAKQVFLISPAIMNHEAAIAATRTAIDVARKVGATRIFYTSHMGVSATSHFPPMVSHAAAEKNLQASGVPFVSLRNGFYASTVAWMIGDALKSGELALPEDGPVAWTSHPDLAEAAALIAVKGGLDGASSNLTASEAVDFTHIAALASELTGRKIRRVVVSEEKYRESLGAKGMPVGMINSSLGIFRASRAGDFSKAGPALENLIGRKPQTIRDVLQATLSQPTKA